MASQVSIAILSFTRFVFMGEEGVYNISIYTMKEMKEKLDWLSQSKNSLFIYLIGFTSLLLL